MDEQMASKDRQIHLRADELKTTRIARWAR